MKGDQHMKKITLWAATAAVSLGIAGCASVPSAAEISALTTRIVQASFRTEGIAKVERLPCACKGWRKLRRTELATTLCLKVLPVQPKPKLTQRVTECAALLALQL